MTCEPISSLLDNYVFVENQGSSYGAMVTYTCKHNYQFIIADENLDPTASIRKTVRCNLDGTWGPNFADCYRTSPPSFWSIHTARPHFLNHFMYYRLYCVAFILS